MCARLSAAIQFLRGEIAARAMLRTTLRILGSITQGKVTKYNHSIQYCTRLVQNFREKKNNPATQQLGSHRISSLSLGLTHDANQTGVQCKNQNLHVLCNLGLDHIVAVVMMMVIMMTIGSRYIQQSKLRYYTSKLGERKLFLINENRSLAIPLR